MGISCFCEKPTNTWRIVSTLCCLHHQEALLCGAGLFLRGTVNSGIHFTHYHTEDVAGGGWRWSRVWMGWWQRLTSALCLEPLPQVYTPTIGNRRGPPITQQAWHSIFSHGSTLSPVSDLNCHFESSHCQAVEMAQGVKVCAAKTNDLDSIPEIHIVERENWFPQQVVLWLTHVPCGPPPPDTQRGGYRTSNCSKKFK